MVTGTIAQTGSAVVGCINAHAETVQTIAYVVPMHLNYQILKLQIAETTIVHIILYITRHPGSRFRRTLWFEVFRGDHVVIE